MWHLVLTLAGNALIVVVGLWVHRMFPKIPTWALVVTAMVLGFGVIPIAAFEPWREIVFSAPSQAVSLIQFDSAPDTRNAELWTRPLYRPDYERDRLIVRECERRAIEEGRLHNLMRNDVKRATEHFRWCLGDQGLGWEKCEAAESGCGLFRYLGMHSPTGTMGSDP